MLKPNATLNLKSFHLITGGSAGGHLSALAGPLGFVKHYTVNSASIEIEGNVEKFTAYSSSVDAVVDWL